MPSFVSTLAGLLAFLGLQLYVLGRPGSINLPYDSPLVNFGQTAGHARRGSPTCSRPAAGRSRHASPAAIETALPSPAADLSCAIARRCSCCSGGHDRRARGGRLVPRTRTAASPGCSACSSALVVADELRVHPHEVGPLDDRRRRQPARRRGAPASTSAASTRSAFMLCSTLAAVGGVLAAGTARLGQPAGRHRRRQPQRHRRRGDRRHQPVRRPRQRLLRPARHHRHPVDRQRPDAARTCRRRCAT